MNALLERFYALNSRERRFVVVAVAAIVFAVLFLVFVDPALSGRARLRRDLARLRTDAAEMAGLAAVANQRPLTRRAGSEADLRGAVESNLGPFAGRAAVSTNGGVVVVKFERVGYPAVVGWAQRVARDTGAHIETVSVAVINEPGRVNAEFGFAR